MIIYLCIFKLIIKSLWAKTLASLGNHHKGATPSRKLLEGVVSNTAIWQIRSCVRQKISPHPPIHTIPPLHPPMGPRTPWGDPWGDPWVRNESNRINIRQVEKSSQVEVGQIYWKSVSLNQHESKWIKTVQSLSNNGWTPLNKWVPTPRYLNVSWKTISPQE